MRANQSQKRFFILLFSEYKKIAASAAGIDRGFFPVILGYYVFETDICQCSEARATGTKIPQTNRPEVGVIHQPKLTNVSVSELFSFYRVSAPDDRSPNPCGRDRATFNPN